MTAPTPGQAARPDGFRDYTCGLCGQEMETNLPAGDIVCECDAQLCPNCHAWFGYNGEIAPAPGPQPAPELAAAMAETGRVQDALAAVLSQFAKGGSGWTARIGQVALARAWAASGKPVPDELRRFL